MICNVSCSSPKKAFIIGETENGKNLLLIRSHRVDHVEFINGKWIDSYNSWVNPSSLRVVRHALDIPCGKCMDCKLSYSREWSARMLMEAQYHKYNYFITLTYNDVNLPYQVLADEDGVLTPVPTLKKKDMQDFLKRLRYHLGKDFKYYMCGEYGSETFRPHYHMILFSDIEIPDLEFLKTTRLSDVLYTSDMVDSVWSNGHTFVGDVTAQSCNYVARYVVKKTHDSAREKFFELGLQPEYVSMSTKPAIGKQWYEDNKDWIFEVDTIYLKSRDGGIQATVPRYFRKLLEKENLDKAKAYSETKQESARKHSKLLNEQSDKCLTDMLKANGENKLAKTKFFERRDLL